MKNLIPVTGKAVVREIKADRKRVLELRAMPTLLEQRNLLIEEMESMMTLSESETRALTEEEETRFDEIKDEISKIDNTLERQTEARKLGEFKERKVENKTETTEEMEVRAFANFVRGEISGETRADVNLTVGDNGAVIPNTIAKRIIERVKELSPILQRAQIFNVGGDLTFPYYDEETQKITAAYADEFKKLTSTSGKFASITLKGYLTGALSKISRSLINKTDFDLVNYVIDKMAEAFAEFFEKEFLVGKTKIKGLINAKQVVTTAGAEITADDLIDLQMAIPTVFNKEAVWVMHKDVFKAIRKLKTNDGEYLLNKDLRTGFGWDLLGNHVDISENAPKDTVFYGDMSGLYVKFVEALDIQVLREKYADEHAIGVVGWAEVDASIVEEQKIAALNVKPAGK